MRKAMKCYICSTNEANEENILVREREALDDLDMSHGNYHKIQICNECNDNIARRIEFEEKAAWTRHEQWVKENPVEAFTLAQIGLDMISGGKSGLEVRDILPDLD